VLESDDDDDEERGWDSEGSPVKLLQSTRTPNGGTSELEGLDAPWKGRFLW